MKNFIFAMCGFLMMSLVSLGVQASRVESPKCEYVNPSVDVGLPDIQCITFEASSVDCVVLITPQPIFMVVDSPVKQTVTITAMQRKQISVPKCPFRYVYKPKYCTHYSHIAYSKLITPY